MPSKMSVDQFAEFASAVVQSLPRDLSSERQQMYITDRALLKADLRRGLEGAVVEQTAVVLPPVYDSHFIPIPDVVAPEKYKSLVAIYRGEARRLGVPDTTPVLYRVRAGFTLKQHAPLAGPCHNRFQYLQSWNFPDEPTTDSWLFVIPVLLPESTDKNVVNQLALLQATRERLNLPEHHMASFGSVGLLAGFQLAHLKTTNERLPQNGLWVRTDTCGSLRNRLSLYWYGGDLYCGYWDRDDEAFSSLGVFALGTSAKLINLSPVFDG